MSNNALPLSILKVSGNDATTFLQGQLTQDISTLDQEWKYAAQCNPQGRVIAFFITFKQNDVIYLLTDSVTVEQTLNDLKKYVMRSKVVFETSEDQAFYLAQPQPTAGIEKADDFQPSVTVQSDSIALQFPYGNIICASQAPEKTSSAEQWHTDQIRSGVPFIQGSILGEFTPESINLDLLGAVSFTKGCYTGQEIVARMHYLGKAKKRLFNAKIQGQLSNLNVGDNISDSEGKTIGHLIDFETGGNALISLKTVQEAQLNRSKQTIQSINGELLL